MPHACLTCNFYRQRNVYKLHIQASPSSSAHHKSLIRKLCLQYNTHRSKFIINLHNANQICLRIDLCPSCAGPPYGSSVSCVFKLSLILVLKKEMNLAELSNAAPIPSANPAKPVQTTCVQTLSLLILVPLTLGQCITPSHPFMGVQGLSILVAL